MRRSDLSLRPRPGSARPYSAPPYSAPPCAEPPRSEPPRRALVTARRSRLGLRALLVAAWIAGLACGKASNEPEVARSTINGVRCLDGAVACGDVCVRLASSAEHCGACDVACGADSVCDRGRCQPASEGCSEQRLLCGSDCVDSRSDREHCGSCGTSCPSEAKCEASACECPGALTACGDSCVDTATDAQHCGSCDVRCFDTQICQAGNCECPAGTDLCASVTLALMDNAVTGSASSQTCANLQSDAQHCGSCGTACTGGQICDQGSCACPSGQILCGDRCVDTLSNLQNCGTCGNACVGGQVCASGSCECPAGQTLCDGKCTDTQTDNAHCGSCTVKCGLGQGCGSGNCQSGALGEDGCQGLAQNISISEIAAYQTVKVDLARDGQAVPPNPAVVAKRPTLFRAFVTPGAGWVARELSARLFLENGQTLTTRFAESTLSVAAASTDADRNSTFEFNVAAELITSDTRYALEIVECGTGTGAAQAPRFPANDGVDLGAVDTGGLKIRVIPLRANNLLPDTSAAGLAIYKAAFLDTYPINAIDITVGDPLDVADAEDWNANLDAVRALRQQQAPAADIYYYGMLKPAATLRQFCGNGCTAGVGFVPNGRLNPATRAAIGLAYSDNTSAFTMLHEVAHNHGRQHAPCVQGGTISGVDPNFPQADGSTGGYGYDSAGDNLLTPQSTDLMGYCRNQWLSAYTYSGILNAVRTVNNVQASVIGTEPLSAWRVLLVDERGARWGKPMAPEVAFGEEEPALVLDATGTAIQTVSVYRTQISDLSASSLQVPEPQPGWESIQVVGAAPIPFRH
jgi:hypothetical protein